MNVLPLLSLAILLLILPLALMPGRTQDTNQPKPEIHGRLTFFHWLVLGYCGLMHRLKTNGWAPLPEAVPAILIPHHTLWDDHLGRPGGQRSRPGVLLGQKYYGVVLVPPARHGAGGGPADRH